MSEVTIKPANGKYATTIVLGSDTQWPFSFGMAKAKLIVEHIEAIKSFVATNGQSIDVASGVGEFSNTELNAILESKFKPRDKIENILTGDKGSVTSVDSEGLFYFNEHGKTIYLRTEDLENYKLQD